MKTRTLHMIGNAHIDPVWLWTWQEGFQEVLATFRSALDRMEEYADFTFTASSAAFYAWVERADPAMFEEIRQRVQEGRWQIAGGWWVEPDCNIPSGESFVRHGLYGQRYFLQKFGRLARVGFNVDSFGHSGTLPQILAKSGLPCYAFLRPMPHEKALPARLFWWHADDGSRVLAFRIPFEYLSWARDLDDHVRRCAAEMKAPVDEFMCFYGVGNHGGGPTRENIESIRRLNADPDLPALAFSTPEAFFAAVESKGWPLPVVYGDLQMHAAGCYAAHSGIKRWNRQAENRLLAAEAWSTLAAWALDRPYPPDFERAWKNVLFNQFHDILAGTSLESAYDDARSTYGEAIAIADRALNDAVQAFAWKVRIEPQEGARPFVVFNPLAWPVRANVELETVRWPGEALLVDERGQPIPFQQVQSVTATSRVRLSFAADLPALGYRTYRLLPEGGPADFPAVQATDTTLENERFRLEFDPQTGCIARLLDKRLTVEVFRGEAARAVVIDDPSDTWSHDVCRFDRVIGEFRAVSVRLVEHGPVKSVVRVTGEYGRSVLVQEFAMVPDRDEIDVQVTLDWREQQKMLKLRFPVGMNGLRVTREIAYGHTEQVANGEEAPFQGWVDVSGTARGQQIAYGLSLLNDGKYSLDASGSDIGLTVLRSPAYAHHVPAVLSPDVLYSYTDQGIQRFTYTLLPHAGGWEQAGTVRRAAELNRRPVVLAAAFHPDGALPQADSFIEVQPDNVTVTVLKQAEDGNDLIVRAYETARTATEGTIRLPKWNRAIRAAFAPGEIKTFRVPRDPALPVVETDLLELPTAAATPR